MEDHSLFFNTFTKYGEDVNFNLQAFLYARFFYSTDQYLYHYVENPFGLSITKCKESYLEHLSLTYKRRIEVYEHFNLDSINCLRGLKTRVCEIFLMQLLLNAWNTSTATFVQELIKIRNSKMMAECFIDYRISGNLSKSLQIIVYLMKYRMYHLIDIIFAVRFFRSAI